ncbi:unnamed protein product [Symbiodinium sp. CCMP2592]|nr:unnamed protein product [Symbiodinium sp. CCMP2592]
MGFGKYVCGDYDSGEEELLNGILRALDVAKSYPRQAMDAVSKAGLGPKSMIIVRVASLNRDTIMNSCNWGARITTGAIQGALLLPDCPANSVRCEAREHLCEASEPSWKCKCTLGYDGEITIPNLDDIQGPFKIVGECKPIAGYCKFDEFKLMLAPGEEAKGVLGETATPDCPKGFEAAGSSECTEGQSREGQWTPIPRCNYIPPNVPPEPFCSSPQLNPTLTFKGCSICFGVEPGKTGPACDCEVHCAQDHEEVGTVGSGQKSCVATEYQCPESIMEGAQCVDSQTKEPTLDFCCDTAWGANIPPPALTEGSCRDIKEDKQCLTSVQSATGADANKAGQPCCWSRSGFGGDASLVCAAKESQAMQGTTPSACAVARRVLKADWAQLPTCIPPCEDTFDRAFLDVSGCERCYGAEATNAPACSCQVQCEHSLLRIGGGPEGSRTCEAATNGEYSFGLPPACQMRPAAPHCPSVDAPGLRPSECANEAGGTCNVACERGFVRTDGGEEGEKVCRAKPKQLEVKTCEDIMEEEECLNSHGQGHTGGDVWSALPCCWNKEGFGNGKKCLQSGSSVISQLPGKAGMGAWGVGSSVAKLSLFQSGLWVNIVRIVD